MKTKSLLLVVAALFVLTGCASKKMRADCDYVGTDGKRKLYNCDDL